MGRHRDPHPSAVAHPGPGRTQSTAAPGPWQEVATWRAEPDGQQRAAVPREAARCGSDPGELKAVLPREMFPWATSARPQRSEAPERGRPTRLRRRSSSWAPPLAPPPATATSSRLSSPSHQPFLPCPGPRASMPPGLLPASSQGRATVVVCMKVRFPQAALAAGCAPPRPRRILRSPCRPAAISDRCWRNLPKTGRKWPNLRLPRAESTEVFVTFRTRPKAQTEGAVGSALQDPRRRLGASDYEKGQELGFEEGPH